MPIYAYACSSCGTRQDVLQKMSAAPLTTCPECGQPTYVKQVTAASFQLKGNGYYVTDFKGGGDKSLAGKPASGKSDEQPTATPASKPELPAVPAPTTSAVPS